MWRAPRPLSLLVLVACAEEVELRAPGGPGARRAPPPSATVALHLDEELLTASDTQQYDYFGVAIASGGDADGDGYDDVLVGANGYDDCAGGGGAYLYFGSPDGVDAASEQVVCPSTSRAAWLGYGVQLDGDYDGDGDADAVVAAPSSKNTASVKTGAIYVCPGGSSGASPSCDELLGSDSASGDAYGWGLSGSADIDGDGLDDVAVTAPNNDAGGVANVGAVYVYYGDSGGLDDSSEQKVAPMVAGEVFGIGIGGPADFDGDGYANLMVSSTPSSTSPYLTIYDGGSAGVDEGSYALLSGADSVTGEGFAISMSEARDVDGDGHLDLAVASPYDMDASDAAGLAYLFLGSTTGLDSSTAQPVVASDVAAKDYFGRDIDLLSGADGVSWMVVASEGGDGVAADSGMAYAYPITGGVVDTSAETRITTSTGASQVRIGRALDARGDVNGDGLADLIMSSDGYTATNPTTGKAGTSSGAAFVYTQLEDPDGDGYHELEDCDEDDPGVHPGATDTCDGIDNDCDPDTTETCWGRDADGDGYGDPDDVVDASVAGAGYVDDTSDCDDDDVGVNPAAEEVAGDEVDQDCDGVELCWLDRDEDGYHTGTSIDSLDEDCDDAVEAGAGEPGGDCDDGDATINPGVTDVTGDSVDSDCDDLESCYADADADGYRDDLGTVVASGDLDCTDTAEADAETPTGDCDDDDAGVHPGAEELPGDELDQDCDGEELCRLDRDDDGYRGHADNTVTSGDTDCADAGEATEADPTGDCDDDDATIWPGAPEVPGDGVDQDCDSGELCPADLDEDEHSDASGATVSSTDLICDGPGEAESSDPADDCDDANSSVYPGVTEIVGDGIDQDCDGVDDIDADGDGAWSLADCDDADPSVYPGADDPAGDGVDQDCDGLESCYQDADGDGYRPDDTSTVASPDANCSSFGEAVSTAPTGDCDDLDAAVHPGVTDVTGDDTDGDCDGLERCYQDADDDGYRPDETSEVAADDADCADPGEALGTEPTGDCDDTEASVHPGGVEVADGLDNDCSGADETVDLDGDGLDELEEQAAGTDATQADTDGDAVSDGDELATGTDPLDTNTDDDGLSDGEELALGTDPLDPDSDDDGLIDGEEVEVHGTDPLDADSDDDGLGDGVEVEETGTLPDDADTDDDGLGDGDEIGTWGTDPFEPDSDGDGLMDGDEVSWTSTDPQDEDSDDDGLSDGDEVITWSTDPNAADSDGDRLTDLDEIEVHGTNPNRADTDQGGVDDGAELEAGTDPLDASDDADSKVTETGCAAAPRGGGPALLAAGLLLLGRRRREGWATRLDRRGTRE